MVVNLFQILVKDSVLKQNSVLSNKSHGEQNLLLQGAVANHTMTSKGLLAWAVLVREQFCMLQARFQVVFYKYRSSSLPGFSVCVCLYTHIHYPCFLSFSDKDFLKTFIVL